MTKKELNELASKKAKISLAQVNDGRGLGTRVIVNMCLSKGECMALMFALEEYAKISAVGADVLAYCKNAIQDGDVSL
jgi:hypothetical protein